MFQWTAEKLQYYCDAAEELRFFDTIAEHLRPYIRAEDRLCDAGCGPGFLSMALAPYCREIVAAELYAPALQFLQNHPEKPNNVIVRLGDVFALPAEEVFDCMIFCLFGEPQEIMDCIRRHCKRTAILLRRADRERHISQNGGHRADITEDWRALEPFVVTKKRISLEMGQPLRSKAAAKQFFRLYGADADFTPEHGNSSKFPYYYSIKRDLEILVLDAQRV